MKKLLLFVFALGLAGCAHRPLDQTPVYKTVEINQPSSVVYGSLVGYPSCSVLMRPEGAFLPHDNSFYVNYMYSVSMLPAPLGLIKGEVIDEESTRLTLYGTKDLDKFITRVQTGTCG